MSSRKARRRRNLAAPEALEEVLDRAGEDRFARRRLPIPIAEWRAAVGPRIASRTRPYALERGVLTVKVTTSVWANELQLLAPELIARLVVRGFAVQSLRFRVGPLELPEREPDKRNYRKIPPLANLGPDLQAAIEGVPDDGLREAIERAARSSLAWQQRPSAVSGAARLSGAPRGARDPRDAGRGTSRPDRTAEGSGAASRGTPEDD